MFSDVKEKLENNMSDIETDDNQASQLAALIAAGVLMAFVIPDFVVDGLTADSQAKLASQPAAQVPQPQPRSPVPSVALLRHLGALHSTLRTSNRAPPPPWPPVARPQDADSQEEVPLQTHIYKCGSKAHDIFTRLGIASEEDLEEMEKRGETGGNMHALSNKELNQALRMAPAWSATLSLSLSLSLILTVILTLTPTLTPTPTLTRRAICGGYEALRATNNLEASLDDEMMKTLVDYARDLPARQTVRYWKLKNVFQNGRNEKIPIRRVDEITAMCAGHSKIAIVCAATARAPIVSEMAPPFSAGVWPASSAPRVRSPRC